MWARSLILPLLAVLWLWPAEANGQSPELMDAYKRAGELYAQGRYQQALPFAEKAVRLGEREFGPDHPRVVTLLNRLAEMYLKKGCHAEAEALFKRALAIAEKALGPEHPDVAKSLENYAALLHKTGRSTEATRWKPAPKPSAPSAQSRTRRTNECRLPYTPTPHGGRLGR